MFSGVEGLEENRKVLEGSAASGTVLEEDKWSETWRTLDGLKGSTRVCSQQELVEGPVLMWVLTGSQSG